jgi:type IV secretion system protein VirD4
MSATRILWGQMLLVLLVAFLFIWAATQWTAWCLGFQAQLGPPIGEVFGVPVYHPLIFFYWWYAYDAYAPRIFMQGAAIAASGGLAAIAVAITMSVLRAREAKRVSTFGSARWADEVELRKGGMLCEDGAIIGRFGQRYIRHNGPEHIMCFAPTRSGKGVGLVLPTLLTWPGSCIVHDIKGENWEQTAGFRSGFGKSLMFDPTNALSAAYNPLLEVRRGANEVRDVQNIADILVDPDGAPVRRDHWEKTAHSLLVGAILHVLYAEGDKTLSGVANFLTNPKHKFDHTLHLMKATRHLGEGGVHPVIASSAQEVANKSPNERSGVLSTAVAALGLYRDPVVAAVTSRSDWRIADLVCGPTPVSLYLVVPPSDISRTKPLMRLILNQVGKRLTEDLRSSATRQKLLFMLDEFPALGKLDFFESQLAFMAGYGIRAVLIAQSLNQIENAYGPNNSILDNCHIRVAFAANDNRTSQRISDSLGTATQLRAMQNFAGHRLSPWLGHVMVSRQETARQLLTPGEVTNFPADEAIILVSGINPIRAKKVRFYQDREIAKRVLRPPLLSPPAAGVRASDDWTDLPLPPVPDPEKEIKVNQAPPETAAPGAKPDAALTGGAAQGNATKPTDEDGDDDDDTTIGRKPGEANDPASVTPPPRPAVREFDMDDEIVPPSADDIQQQNPRQGSGARNSPLDPDNGLDM